MYGDDYGAYAAPLMDPDGVTGNFVTIAILSFYVSGTHIIDAPLLLVVSK